MAEKPREISTAREDLQRGRNGIQVSFQVSNFIVTARDSLKRSTLLMLGEPGGQLTDVDLVPVCS